MDGWMDRLMDRLMDGWMEGWMDGWMNDLTSATESLICPHTLSNILRLNTFCCCNSDKRVVYLS